MRALSTFGTLMDSLKQRRANLLQGWGIEYRHSSQKKKEAGLASLPLEIGCERMD